MREWFFAALQFVPLAVLIFLLARNGLFQTIAADTREARKAGETALREARVAYAESQYAHKFLLAMIQTFFEASPVAMYVTDDKGKVLSCNSAYTKLWGAVSADEAKTDLWLTQLTDQAKLVALARVQSVFDTPRNWSYSAELLDGGTVHFVGHPIGTGDDFAGYMGTVWREDSSED